MFDFGKVLHQMSFLFVARFWTDIESALTCQATEAGMVSCLKIEPGPLHQEQVILVNRLPGMLK